MLPSEKESLPKPLTEDEICALFAPVRKRMVANGYSEEQIRERLDKFASGKEQAEGA